MAHKLEVTITLDEGQLKELLANAGINDSDLNIVTLIGLCRNSEVVLALKEGMTDVLMSECESVLENESEAFDESEPDLDDNDSDSDSDSYNDSYDDSFNDSYDDSYNEDEDDRF